MAYYGVKGLNKAMKNISQDKTQIRMWGLLNAMKMWYPVQPAILVLTDLIQLILFVCMSIYSSVFSSECISLLYFSGKIC